MNRFDAIAARHSTRRFSKRPLSAEQLAAVRASIEAMPVLYDDLELRATVIEQGELVSACMSGFIGSYGKPDAPHFILVTAREQTGWLENAGYAIEHVVLDLAAAGIATCWIGGQATREVFHAADPDIPADHTPVVAIAMGIEQSAGMVAALLARRKPLSELAPEGVGGFSEALEAARLAPSAGNTQPWRFFADGDALHVYALFRTPLIYRSNADHLQLMNQIDVGISLAHVALAEQASGREVRIGVEGAPAREGLHYMATVRRLS